MLEKLITEGDQLPVEVKQGTMGKYLSGQNFEKWAPR